MDVGGQCLLISFQPENHFHAPERIGPMKFHDITLAIEIPLQCDIKTQLVLLCIQSRTHSMGLEAQ